MTARKRSAAVLAGTHGAVQTEQHGNGKPTATAAASGKYSVRCVGGWPRQMETVFAVYPSAITAADMASRLCKSGAVATWQAAEPGDYPGRIIGRAKP